MVSVQVWLWWEDLTRLFPGPLGGIFWRVDYNLEADFYCEIMGLGIRADAVSMMEFTIMAGEQIVN